MSVIAPQRAAIGATAPPASLASLSVVLPCLDEADNLAEMVAEATAAARRCAATHEIVVVDDGSTDDTRAIAESLAREDPRVRVVAHAHNRGYGAAVRSGIDASRGAWVLLTDADLQFDLSELRGMLPLTRRADLVAGYRMDRADPLHRRLAAHLWNRFVRVTFGVGLRDVDCAFKLVRGNALRDLGLRSDGAMISTELEARARRAGWRVVEHGVHHRPRLAGTSSGGDPRVIVRAFAEHRRLARRLSSESGRPAVAMGRPRPRIS